MVHQFQWYHGTLDRNESHDIITQYANQMPEHEQNDIVNDDLLEEGDVSDMQLLSNKFFSHHQD